MLPVILRWLINDRFYVYAETPFQAEDRFAGGSLLPLVSLRRAGCYDPNTNTVETDEPLILFEGRRAPGA